ncbi:MAG: hypothetical protein HEQ40_08140 [Lacibacter sp.]|jgi:hypothetical protein
MKHSLLFSFLFISTIGKSQQNLFNIPSGEVTPGNKFFFQQQINVNNYHRYSAKSHFVYGLGKNWEVGFNIINAYFNFKEKPALLVSTPFNSREPYPLYPIGLITAQKRWNIKEHWHLNIGTQAGTNLYKTLRAKSFTHFTYALAGYHTKDHKFKLVAGPYVTDSRFVGGGNTAGIQAGMELQVHEKWIIMADHISGRHKNSVTVAGLTFNVNERFQLCGGWLIPNPDSNETQAFVFEINLFNF